MRTIRQPTSHCRDISRDLWRAGTYACGRSLINSGVQRVLLCSALLLSLGSAIGCATDRSFPVMPEVVTQYWQLSLNHHAITLALTAPANRLQLTAVPLTANGDTIATDARVHFTSSDSAVQVDSSGLLTAHSPKAGVLIIAKLALGGTQQGLTLVDTAEVNVNAVATVPVFSRLTVQTPGDSAKLASGTAGTLTIKMYDADETVIPNTKFYVMAQDTTITRIATFTSGGHWSNQLTASAIGQTHVMVDATVYGIHLRDTLDIAVGYQIFQQDSLYLTSENTAEFFPQEFKLGPGGVVQFINNTNEPTDIIFDDSTAAQGATYAQMTASQFGKLWCLYVYVCPVGGSAAGNIHALPPRDTFQRHILGFDFRRFPNPGTYPFHTSSFNVSGVIHVE